MVPKPATLSKQQLGQHLIQTLGQSLAKPELTNCFNQTKILEPPAGKKFWQTTDAVSGIYIVLAGKVRLLDSADNLILSLEAGASFGEATLFPAERFHSHAARASLNLVLCFWGKRFSVNRLRDIANVDRNGASLRGLAAAAESIGFATRPVRASLDKLAQQDLPAIAHWEGKHYVVVYKVTRAHVIVADPAISQRTLSHAEFKRGWTGYPLLLRPTALLKETEENSQPFWQLFELVRPHSLVLLFGYYPDQHSRSSVWQRHIIDFIINPLLKAKKRFLEPLELRFVCKL